MAAAAPAGGAGSPCRRLQLRRSCCPKSSQCAFSPHPSPMHLPAACAAWSVCQKPHLLRPCLSAAVQLAPTQLDALDCLVLDYRVGWPLSAVITEVRESPLLQAGCVAAEEGRGHLTPVTLHPPHPLCYPF